MKRPIMARVQGRKVPVLVKVKGGYRPATMAEVRRAKAGRVLRRNPQWLTGAMPRKIESGQHMTRFYDAGKRLKAEMFEDGREAPRLLVHNPRVPVGPGTVQHLRARIKHWQAIAKTEKDPALRRYAKERIAFLQARARGEGPGVWAKNPRKRPKRRTR
jgi:hypothetical protein